MFAFTMQGYIVAFLRWRSILKPICLCLSFCNYVCVCQLVLTVGLLAVVVYLYTVVAFNFFRKFYNKSDDKDTKDMKCNDMLTVS